jgi:hypothetical protein
MLRRVSAAGVSASPARCKLDSACRLALPSCCANFVQDGKCMLLEANYQLASGRAHVYIPESPSFALSAHPTGFVVAPANS